MWFKQLGLLIAKLLGRKLPLELLRKQVSFQVRLKELCTAHRLPPVTVEILSFSATSFYLIKKNHIKIAYHPDEREMWYALYHEFRHHWQFSLGHAKLINRGRNILWFGRKYKFHNSVEFEGYDQQPWEVDANCYAAQQLKEKDNG